MLEIGPRSVISVISTPAAASRGSLVRQGEGDVLQRARDEGEPLEGLWIGEYARVGQFEEVQTPRLGIPGLDEAVAALLLGRGDDFPDAHPEDVAVEADLLPGFPARARTAG
jgi:hypothetical protein